MMSRGNAPTISVRWGSLGPGHPYRGLSIRKSSVAKQNTLHVFLLPPRTLILRLASPTSTTGAVQPDKKNAAQGDPQV